jgi:DNA-binding XRE family transcriptional regulator
MLTKEIFTQKIAQKVKNAREEAGLSQEELAHQAGIYRTYIGHIENGRYSPSAYIIYKIAKVLKVNLNDLLPM